MAFSQRHDKNNFYFFPEELAKESKNFPLPDFSNFFEKPIEEKKLTNYNISVEKVVEPEKKKILPKKIPKAPKVVDRFVQCLEKFKNVDEKDFHINAKIKSIEASSDEDRYFNNVDVIVRFFSLEKEQRIKVLERKKFLMSDEEEQDLFFWIMLQGTKLADTGYLHEESLDLIAQEISGGFVLVRRDLLKKHIYDKLPQDGKTTSIPKDAIYRIFRIGLRRELKTLVPAEDILSDETIPGCLITLYYDDKK